MAGYPLDLSAQEVLNDTTQDGVDSEARTHKGGSITASTVPARVSSKSAPTSSSSGQSRDGPVNFSMRSLHSPLPSTPEALSKRKPVPGSSGESPADKALDFAPSGGKSVRERTEDTTVYRRQAPAVTHETVFENIHEHEHQRISREIHEHHVYHRILPVHDVEVLPAVHYIMDENGVRQISEGQIPGGRLHNVQQAVEEGFKKALPKDTTTPGRRHFTARHFPGTEGDYRESATADGVKRSETWWVHPPTLSTGARDSGQTQPFHFDSVKTQTRKRSE